MYAKHVLSHIVVTNTMKLLLSLILFIPDEDTDICKITLLSKVIKFIGARAGNGIHFPLAPKTLLSYLS